MNTAIVVETQQMAEELNKILTEGNKAFSVGGTRLGYRFDKILVTNVSATDSFENWFGHFVCCLTPDGVIIHD